MYLIIRYLIFNICTTCYFSAYFLKLNQLTLHQLYSVQHAHWLKTIYHVYNKYNIYIFACFSLSLVQFQWVLCVQESVMNSVVARLKFRMTGMKCVVLATETDRNLLDAAVQDAQQQGATVREHLSLDFLAFNGWMLSSFCFLVVLYLVADPVVSTWNWCSLPPYCTVWTGSFLRVRDFTSSRPCAAPHILQELCWGSYTRWGWNWKELIYKKLKILL